MARYRLDTLTDFMRHGYRVRVVCQSCDNVTVWAPDELIVLLSARRISPRVEVLEQRMKCSRCGEREALISASIET